MVKKIIFVVILILSGIVIFAEYPSVVFGIGAEPFIISESQDPSVIFLATTIEANLSLRTRLGDTGYFSLLAGGEGGFIFDSAMLVHDKELLSFETGLQLGDGRIVLTGGLESSLNGTITDNPFIEPNWQILYQFNTARNTIQPYIVVIGNWQVHQIDNEDVFSQGAEIGFYYSPEAVSEYSVHLGGGWEYWYEYPRYLFSGSRSDEKRHDFVAILSGKAGGLYDFFLQWDIELSAFLRISNANRYIAALLFYEETSENRIDISLSGTTNFSPNRFVNIKIVPIVGFNYYFMRKAISETPTILDNNVMILRTSGLIHFDWTPNNKVYFIIEVEGSRYFSNDAEADKWMLKCFFGIKGIL